MVDELGFERTVGFRAIHGGFKGLHLVPAAAQISETLTFVVVNSRSDSALEACSDKGALGASSLAERKKLDDHETMLIISYRRLGGPSVKMARAATVC